MSLNKNGLSSGQPQPYINYSFDAGKIAEQIQTESDNAGKSNTLIDFLKTIAWDPYELGELKYLAPLYALHDLFDTSRAKDDQEKAREFLLYMLNCCAHIAAPQSDAGGSGRTGRASVGNTAQVEEEQARRRACEDANRIMQQAQEEADRIKSEAKAEAEALQRQAQAEKDRIVNEAEAEAKSIRLAQDNAKLQDDSAYQPQRESPTFQAVKDLVEEYRRSDAEVYRASEEHRAKLLLEREQDHADLCAQIKKLQADIVDALSTMQNSLCDYLTQWREAFYGKEAMGLAECCVDIHKIMNHLDTQIAEAAASGADSAASQQLVDLLGRIQKNLNRFAKRFRKAMPEVGLDAYLPVEGDRFDPAQHTLEGGGDEDGYKLEGREIASCKVPGVRTPQRGGAAKSFEPLIRAEVTLKQEGVR